MKYKITKIKNILVTCTKCKVTFLQRVQYCNCTAEALTKAQYERGV
jgi:hypothetical protein